MIRRSREINVFSMSALDLFASALGAFILLSIVMMPTFANLSPVVVALPTSPEPVPVEPLSPVQQLPPLDLVIALDVTGSMWQIIDGLKAQIDQLSRILIEMTPSLGMGVVAFGDEEAWTSPICELELRTITGSAGNYEQLRSFLMALSPNLQGVSPPAGCSGNGWEDNIDDPEGFLLALQEAVNASWRPDSERRVIVMITDNPAYPDEQQQAIAAAASFLVPDHQMVSVAYHFTRCPAGDCEEIEDFLRRVADAGGGRYVPAGGSVTGVILRMLL